jgi:hypothetical protein
MWRLLATTLITALVTGVTGFVLWGLPLQRLRDDVDALFEKSSVTQALCAEFGSRVTSRPGRGPDETRLSERPK